MFIPKIWYSKHHYNILIGVKVMTRMVGLTGGISARIHDIIAYEYSRETWGDGVWQGTGEDWEKMVS